MANFFSTPKPKSFHIEPRYWDPKKEEREARQRRINAELGIDDGGEYKAYIPKGEFRKGMSKGKFSAQVQRRKSNTRLLVLVVLIAGIVYWMLS